MQELILYKLIILWLLQVIQFYKIHWENNNSKSSSKTTIFPNSRTPQMSRLNQPTKKLSVTIHDAQFAKDFQYCIRAQFQNQKQTTDVSAIARNPVFANNTMIFNLTSNHTVRGSIIFVVSILTEEEQPQYSKNPNPKASSKILGECSLDLTPFGLMPTQNYNLPIRQQIKFLRTKEGRQVSVGRCIVSFKIVDEDDVQMYLEQIESKKVERREIYTDLPDYDEDPCSFKWRLKAEIRHAYNIQSVNSVLPQVSVEVGWTEYRDTLPEESRIYSTSIMNSEHPEWNQTILIANPVHIEQVKGFVMVLMKDSNNLEDIVRLYVPLDSMGLFVPYNLKIISSSGSKENQGTSPTQLYISLILEAPQNSREKLYDLVISDIIFQPLVAPFTRMNLILLPSPDQQPSVEFYPFNPKQDSIERILEFDQARQFTFIMSQSLNVPPVKSSRQYRAATIMTIPENFFRKGLEFYLVGQFESGQIGKPIQYKICGETEPIEKDLVLLVVEKVKKQLFVPVRARADVKMGRCQIQISHKDQTRIEKEGSRVGSRASRRGQDTASERLMKDLNISSNQSFFKHLTQNNQIISRILRQLDDKSQSLKQAASEIADLRGKVKLLQSENSILRRKAMSDEDQLVNMVQREIQTMSQRDLKDKIVKISQLYKGERIKTKQLDKVLKVMQPQVSNTMQLNSIISNQKNNIQAINQKLEKTKRDIDRIGIYKDTIKKQEKVIEKLERVMREGMSQVRSAKQVRIQLEELKKRGGSSYQPMSHNREEIQRLQRTIAELQANRPITNLNMSNVSNGNNSYELQFKLHQAETRIEYLEQQIQEKAKSYARELAMMKMKIAQKEAILDGFSH